MTGYITVLDGTSITWSDRDGHLFVAAIVDLQSTTPARRVDADGTIIRVSGEHQGITHYGQPGAPIPFQVAAAVTPEYADLLLIGVAGGHGVTALDHG